MFPGLGVVAPDPFGTFLVQEMRVHSVQEGIQVGGQGMSSNLEGFAGLQGLVPELAQDLGSGSGGQRAAITHCGAVVDITSKLPETQPCVVLANLNDIQVEGVFGSSAVSANGISYRT